MTKNTCMLIAAHDKGKMHIAQRYDLMEACMWRHVPLAVACAGPKVVEGAEGAAEIEVNKVRTCAMHLLSTLYAKASDGLSEKK